MAIKDTVACGGVRLPEIRRPRCFTPLATGDLRLRGEGDIRCQMLHSRFVEGLEPCGVLMIWLRAVKVMRTVKVASGAKLQVARGDWWQVRQVVTSRRGGVGVGDSGTRSDRQRRLQGRKEVVFGDGGLQQRGVWKEGARVRSAG